jgi:hypothetical protein
MNKKIFSWILHYPFNADQTMRLKVQKVVSVLAI